MSPVVHPAREVRSGRPEAIVPALWRRALAVTATAIAMLALGVGPASAGRLEDASGDTRGPLDLRAVALAQDGPDLVWVVRTGGRLTASALGRGGRSLCLLTANAGGRRELCLVVRSGVARLRRATLRADGTTGQGRLVAARIVRPGVNQLRARFTPAAAGLRVGGFRWRVRSTWREAGVCGSDRGAGERRCLDLAPGGPAARGVVRTPVPVGCTAAGPSFHQNGPRGSRAVAFGLDDGPSPYTPGMLDVLRRNGAHATFFEVGQNVAGRGAVMRRILAEGHSIGDHSWSHPVLSGGGGFAAGQISSTARAIHGATAFTPCLFRPPYGAVSGALVAVARAQRMLTINWDVDPRDWSTPGTGAIVSRVLSQIRPGSIVVMHDGGGPRGQSVSAMGQILPALRRRGLHAVTIERLLGLRLRYS